MYIFICIYWAYPQSFVSFLPFKYFTKTILVLYLPFYHYNTSLSLVWSRLDHYYCYFFLSTEQYSTIVFVLFLLFYWGQKPKLKTVPSKNVQCLNLLLQKSSYFLIKMERVKNTSSLQIGTLVYFSLLLLFNFIFL